MKTALNLTSLFLSTSLAFVACSAPGMDDWEDTQEREQSLSTSRGSRQVVGFHGKCLTAASSNNGQPVTLSDCLANASSQRWTFASNGQIKGPGGKCLNVAGGSGTNGSSVILWPCSATPLSNELWNLTNDNQLVGMEGKCLNVQGGSHANGTPTILWPCVGAINEKWISPSSLLKIRVDAIAVSDDDGSNAPSMTAANFKSMINNINGVYSQAGIEFEFDEVASWYKMKSSLANSVQNVVPQDQGYKLAPANQETALHSGRISIFIVNGVKVGGMSTGPDDNAYSSVFIQNSFHGNLWPLVAHELGHFLGLSHTHQEEKMSVASISSVLDKSCDVSELDNDGLDDTPIDPGSSLWGGSGCVSPMTITSNTAPYCSFTFDPDIQNMMSYWGNCAPSVRSISPKQIKKMRDTLQHPKRIHLVNEAIPSPVSDVAAGLTSDGRIQLYAVGADGRLSTKWKESSDPNAPFTEWKSFGFLPTAQRVGTMKNSNGYPQVFFSNQAGSWTKWQSDATNWSANTAFSMMGSAKDFSSAVRPQGLRPRVYYVDSSGQIKSVEKDPYDTNSAWTVGPSLPVLPSAAHSVAVGKLGDGRHQVFVVTQDGDVYSSWEISSGTNTSPWSVWNLEGSYGDTNSVDVATFPDGSLGLFSVSDTSIEYKKKMSSDPNSPWETWQAIGNLTLLGGKRITAFSLPDGRPQVLVVNATGQILTRWYRSPSEGWSDWKGL